MKLLDTYGSLTEHAVADPLAWLPPYRIAVLRYGREVVSPHLRYLAESSEYEWHVAAVPNSARSSVGARAAVEDQVSVRPGSFLWGLTSWSSRFEGFRFQVWDQGASRTLFHTFVNNTAAAGTLQGPRPRGPFLLPRPYLVQDPGLLTVQIINLAPNAANNLQLALHFAQRRLEASR